MGEETQCQNKVTTTQENTLDEEVIQLESEDSSRAKPSKTTLVGRIISAKAFNRNIAINMLKKGWDNPDKMSVVEVESYTFVFGFQDKDTP